MLLWKCRNIHRKTPVLESLFNKVTALQLYEKTSENLWFSGSIEMNIDVKYVSSFLFYGDVDLKWVKVFAEHFCFVRNLYFE